jgi:uncharacterized protein
VVRELLNIFCNHVGKTRCELEVAIEKYAAGRTDYRILRGLAKILMGFSEFEMQLPDTMGLRSALFVRAAKSWPIVRRQDSPLETDRYSILAEVSGEIGLTPAQLEEALYADLPERRKPIHFAVSCGPEALIARYNIELARGLLYWDERMVIEVEDSYQDIFRYMKLCRLMHTILRPERGYRIELDGPLSILQGSIRYGVKMAVFLPALALCRAWRMEAIILKRLKKSGPKCLSATDSENFPSRRQPKTKYKQRSKT